MKEKKDLIIKYGRAMLVMALLSLLSLPGIAQNMSEARWDALLSGMGGKTDDPDFDAVLSGMGVKNDCPDFDAMLAGMGVKETYTDKRLEGVLASMSITNALDYLEDAYSSKYLYQNPYSYNSDGVGVYPTLPGGAVLPITGRVTSRFGFRPSFGRMHKGVDVALNVGDTIVAAIDGRVERVSIDPKGYGLFICLSHSNGIETRYAHLSHSLVSAGMQVYAGQPIALGGNTGNSTGPHLHFETRVNGTALDPLKMFDFSMPGQMRSMRNLAALDMANPAYAGSRYQNMNPMAANAPSATPMATKHTYVVKAGDTIATIAKRNGISVLTLCRLNSLSSTDALTPGRMLRIR